MIEAVAGRHGLTLAIGEDALERVPVRRPARPSLPRRRTRMSRGAARRVFA
jgi:hypothetical protein